MLITLSPGQNAREAPDDPLSLLLVGEIVLIPGNGELGSRGVCLAGTWMLAGAPTPSPPHKQELGSKGVCWLVLAAAWMLARAPTPSPLHNQELVRAATFFTMDTSSGKLSIHAVERKEQNILEEC